MKFVPIPRKVYMAGPISHVSFRNATDWRKDFSEMMAEIAPHVTCASPLRSKEYLSGLENIPVRASVNAQKRPLSTDRGIMTRDHWDCMSSDAIVANLLGTERVSIGTVMEIAWAYAYRKPLVLIMETEGNIHDHPLISEAAGFHVTTLQEAAKVCASILTA
jgi:nucleoside 2-deoxyribosyltransferase